MSCVWGWWLWRQSGEKQLAEWRKKASTIGLATLTLSIATGAFAFLYWRQFPARAPVPPAPTQVATLAGFGIAVFSAPFVFLSYGRMRVAMILCWAGLMGFYFGMFVSP